MKFFLNLAVIAFAAFTSCGSDSSSEQLATPANVCGGTTENVCEAGNYCKFPEGSCGEGGEGGETGECEQKAEICATIFDPVCGCDGKTYPSSCNAASAGISVRSKGECAA